MTTLDKYLKNLNEEENISEIVPLAFLAGASLFGLFTWLAVDSFQSAPKHPKWRKLLEQGEEMKKRCEKNFPDERSVTTRKSSTGEDITYETYKENPKQVKCIMMARAEILKRFIKWISTEKPENICKYNKEKKRLACMRIVDNMKKKNVKELAELTRVLRQAGETNKMSKAEFDKVAGALSINININK